MSWTIAARHAVIGDRVHAGVTVRVEGDTIVEVVAGGAADSAAVEVEWLSPGLIDVQVNGLDAIDLATADDAAMGSLAASLAHRGTTAFCPTAITAPLDDLLAFAGRVAQARTAAPDALDRAELLGVHLEGPFLAPGRVGAHPPERLAVVDDAAIEQLVAAHRHASIAIVTLAPEQPGAMAAVERLSAAGITVSIGHSDATAAQTRAAIDAGARMVTHLFNAQRPFHHREPGVIGRALVDDRVFVGLIGDLHHVAADAVMLAMRAAAGRVVLVSDVVASRPEHVGSSPPTLADGTLAGAAQTLDQAVRNLVGIGLDPGIVLGAASAVPARLLGRTDIGVLRAGGRADLVAWDADFNVQRVWRAGAPIVPAPR